MNEPNELYLTILKNIDIGIIFLDKSGTILWENISKKFPYAQIIVEKRFAVDRRYLESDYHINSMSDNSIIQKILKSKKEAKCELKFNSEITLEFFGKPIFDDSESLKWIIIRVEDITFKKKIILEKQKAEEANYLKSAFLANMSHEIRTPLNSIVGFSELMLTAESDEEREEYYNIISTNNILLLKLINDILDLSKLEAGRMKLFPSKFNLSTLFIEIGETAKLSMINENVKLIVDNPTEVFMVRLDRNRLTQIIMNFVTNAIKYTPSGYIKMGYKAKDGGVYIYVEDTGIGIADDKKEKVFHRFEKLDQFAQGTGLGLSICKAFAEMNGGKIGFSSQEGKGSTFWIWKPKGI